MDGNERTSFVVAVTFLAMNGHELPRDDIVNTVSWLKLAGGEMDESAFAAWLRAQIRPDSA